MVDAQTASRAEDLRDGGLHSVGSYRRHDCRDNRGREGCHWGRGKVIGGGCRADSGQLGVRPALLQVCSPRLLEIQGSCWS